MSLISVIVARTVRAFFEMVQSSKQCLLNLSTHWQLPCPCNMSLRSEKKMYITCFWYAKLGNRKSRSWHTWCNRTISNGDSVGYRITHVLFSLRYVRRIYDAEFGNIIKLCTNQQSAQTFHYIAYYTRRVPRVFQRDKDDSIYLELSWKNCHVPYET